MNKRGILGAVVLYIIILFVFAGNVSGEVIKENKFSDLGFEGFKAEGEVQKACKQYVFLKEESDLKADVQNILSLHADFKPTKYGKAKIRVLANQNLVKELDMQDFIEGWQRITLPNEILEEENQIEVCMETSYSITEIELFDDSSMGVYRAADFEKGNSFVKVIETKYPEVQKPVTITIIARNYGNEEAEVSINYWKVDSRGIELVKGETEFNGVVKAFNHDENKPGEVSISYIAFPKYELQMTLPAATLTYTNIFGDEITLRSTQPNIRVQEQEKKVKTIFSTDKELYNVNDIVRGKVIVKNVSNEDLENLSIEFTPYNGLEVDQQEFEIGSFGINESEELYITGNSLMPGRYELGCIARYELDGNSFEEECRTEKIFFEGQRYDFSLLYAIVFMVLGAGVYLYIAFKKDN